MKQLWQSISHIGIEHGNGVDIERENILLNRLNFIAFWFMLVIFIILFFNERLYDGFMGASPLRILLFMLACIIHLVLNRFRFFRLSKFLMLIDFPFLLLFFNILFGTVDDEYYFWYPYAIVAVSIIPQHVFSFKHERPWILGFLAFYFVIALFTNNILNFFAGDALLVHDLLGNFVLYYKIAYLAIFLFINLTIYYLLSLNLRQETSIHAANEELHQNQKILVETNRELSDQRQKLYEKNLALDQALKNLKETQAMLVRSEKMASIGTLVTGVAHEINNPLNFISGSLQVIEMNLRETLDQLDKLSPEARRQKILDMIELMSHTHEGTERISGIVSSLMTFSYRGNTRPVTCNLPEIIDATLGMLKHEIPESLEIRKQYQPVPRISCFKEKLHQVLLNILQNALHAINSAEKTINPSIVITTDMAENGNQDQLSIRIFNSGPQIPDKHLDQIFDPFFTTKDPGEGTGLGLFICYSIINEIHGEIRAVNEENGVSFTILLPVTMPPETE